MKAKRNRIFALFLAAILIVSTAKFSFAKELEDLATATDAQPEEIYEIGGAIETSPLNAQGFTGEPPTTGWNQLVNVLSCEEVNLGGGVHSAFEIYITDGAWFVGSKHVGFCSNSNARRLGGYSGVEDTSLELGTAYKYCAYNIDSLGGINASNVKKALYYGYNGVTAGCANWSSYSKAEQITLTTDAIQAAMGGGRTQLGGQFGHYSNNPLYNNLDNLPAPPSSGTDNGFVISSGAGKLGTDKQRSNTITFDASSTKQVTFTLPTGYELYFTEDPTTPYTDSVTVTGGDSFYLVVPADYVGSYTGIGAVDRWYLEAAYEIQPANFSRNGEGVQGIVYGVYSNINSTFTVSFTQTEGYFQLQKLCRNDCLALVAGNPAYSLEGAVYTLYSDYASAASRSSSNRITSVTTDAAGYAISGPIAEGTYYLIETTSPKGYALSDEIQTISITASDITNALSITATEVPQMDPVRVLLNKQGADGTPIMNAEYTFRYYATTPQTTDPALSGSTPDRTWVLKTNADGFVILDESMKVSGDDFYYYPGTTMPGLPLGTVTIQETKAPDGYLLDTTVYVVPITADGTTDIIETYNAPTSIEHMVRGDLAFTKKDSKTGDPIGNVLFTITDEHGASVSVWTDENGYYSTSSSFAAHSNNTNAGNKNDGVWFGSEAVNDTLGALPAGVYTMKEQRCEANKNKYKDLASFTVTIRGAAADNGKIYTYGDVLNERFPTLSSQARDNVTNTNMASAAENVTIIDKVTFESLEIGHTYTVEGFVMDKETGNKLLDQSGSPYSSSYSFVATSEGMTMDTNTFTVDTSCLKGKDVVIYEYLYDAAYPGELVAFHTDINDGKQTIHFPDIKTNAKGDTDSHAFADEDVEITDTVSYDNLIIGKTYTVSGILMDKETNAPLLDDEGNKITSTKTFTAEAENGSIDVEFTFKGVTLAGRTMVVFEDLYSDSIKVATHADITDEDQTVEFPKIKTKAMGDVESMLLADEEVTITDRVGGADDFLDWLTCQSQTSSVLHRTLIS